ncbi:dienelactone hydrolase family protein [Luteimonas sp. MC1782]|uniref:dienelactone hydrolase family protein n=1 Tax=Luteimonas sp. MC1782 TaxID=2760305 RepID=UPI0016048B1A|nr:dienelactone hydrolase family protein [Luteimonas sp. MC1782]MBB1472312.1 dienelactone hydrolase family protein [Luteimonas sp. MC1782]
MGTRGTLEVPGIGEVGTWLARPDATPRCGLVVVQEIFGVNAHMRAVTDRYARDGLLALAPALFDPVERDAQLAYDEAGFEGGRALASALGFERAVAIVAAAAAQLRTLLAEASPGAPACVAVVGFCWGGSVAWLANTRLGLPAVSYYGARTVQFLDEPMRAPMLFHFGGRDHSIPPADVEAHRRAQPAAELHVHDAGHGFNRDVDPLHHDAASARLAHERTLDFLHRACGAPAGAAPPP